MISLSGREFESLQLHNEVKKAELSMKGVKRKLACGFNPELMDHEVIFFTSLLRRPTDHERSE